MSLWSPYIVCSVTSVTLHKSLFCHLSDPTQEFVWSLRWPYTRVCSIFTREVNWIIGPVISPLLQSQLSIQTYRASYRFRPTGPVIGPFLHGQLSVHFCRASYRSRYTGLVIGPDIQGQWSVNFFKASERSNASGPVNGPMLQGQWSVQFFRASDQSISSIFRAGYQSTSSVLQGHSCWSRYRSLYLNWPFPHWDHTCVCRDVRTRLIGW